jgi:hypothetical protein
MNPQAIAHYRITARDNRIMVVSYTTTGRTFTAAKPHLWFSKQIASVGLTANLDLAPDGKRFAVLMPAQSAEPRGLSSHVTLITNFFDEVRRRMTGQGN